MMNSQLDTNQHIKQTGKEMDQSFENVKKHQSLKRPSLLPSCTTSDDGNLIFVGKAICVTK